MIDVSWNTEELKALHPGRVMPAIAAAVRKAGATALRDMKSEATKRVRARKRIKVGEIRKSFQLRSPRAKEIDGADWTLLVKGGRRIPLTKFPHRQTKRGVSVEINRGQRTLIKGAFVATMKSGHKGVFRRQTTKRLPIAELLGSRPVDALLHEGEAEAVRERGRASFEATFGRMLPIEFEKVAAKGRQMASRAKKG